jgi:fructose-bisphosphate aldolase class I
MAGMNIPALVATARALVANNKGLLAMDESVGTCNRRFASAGIPQTEEMRRAYRELLLTSPGLGTCINGVILYDETIRQSGIGGTRLVQVAQNAGLLVGIKVDIGAKDLAAHAGERVTEGLDRLRERLQTYFEMGARFAKWRGVILADSTRLPTEACVDANAHALARYATLCQEAGLVPIIEPEVLMTGTHTLGRCQEVTEAVLRAVFTQLQHQGVVVEALILKPNMVIAGLNCATQNSAAEVAQATRECLLRAVPAAVPGIAFLSGGQSAELASERLNAMHVQHGMRALGVGDDVAPQDGALPWPLSFSFGRALQQPALHIWAGKNTNRITAQKALMHRARCNCAALKGKYTAAMESP